jgi:hypothetical protein
MARLEDLTIAGFTRETICKDPGSIRGSDFTIEDLTECTVYVMDCSSQMTVDNVTKSFLFIGPVQGSFFLRDCTDSVICVACRQFRTKNVKNCKIFLYCSQRPAIEYTKDIQLAPYNFAYPHQDEHFTVANLNPVINDWMNVHDFNADGTTHWTELPPSEFFFEFKELIGYTAAVNPVTPPPRFANSKGRRPVLAGSSVATEEIKTVNKRPLFSISQAIGGGHGSDQVASAGVEAFKVYSAGPAESTPSVYKPFSRLEAEASLGTNAPPPSSPQATLHPYSASLSSPPHGPNSAASLSSPPGPYSASVSSPTLAPYSIAVSSQPPGHYSASSGSQPLAYSADQSSQQPGYLSASQASQQPSQVPQSSVVGGTGAKFSLSGALQSDPAVVNRNVQLSVPLRDSPGKSYVEEASVMSAVSLFKGEQAPLKPGADSAEEVVFEYHKGKGYQKPTHIPHTIKMDVIDSHLQELSIVANKAQDRIQMLEYTVTLIFLGLMLHILLAVCLRLIEEWFVAAWALFLFVFLVCAIISAVVVVIKLLRTKKAANAQLQEMTEKIDLRRNEWKLFADLNSFRMATSYSVAEQ